MTRRWRIFLSILLCPILFGYGVATFSLETLLALHEEATPRTAGGPIFYIVWHFILPPVFGVWMPWIAWYRSPHNSQNHSSVLNNTDASGVTLLHSASFKGHKKHAELLIANGANLNARQKYGDWTPLDMANCGKKNKVADLLRKHGGKTGAELKAEGK